MLDELARKFEIFGRRTPQIVGALGCVLALLVCVCVFAVCAFQLLLLKPKIVPLQFSHQHLQNGVPLILVIGSAGGTSE